MTHDHPEAAIADAASALLGFFLRRVELVDDAAELVNETLIEAWKVVHRIPSDSQAARMWLFGVARNVLRHHRRSGRRRDALVERLGQAVQLARVADEDVVLEVRAAVRSLPGNLAELIRLVHWDGFTLEEAAVHLGIPASTARGRHARAKALLRAILGEVENDSTVSSSIERKAGR